MINDMQKGFVRKESGSDCHMTDDTDEEVNIIFEYDQDQDEDSMESVEEINEWSLDPLHLRYEGCHFEFPSVDGIEVSESLHEVKQHTPSRKLPSDVSWKNEEKETLTASDYNHHKTYLLQGRKFSEKMAKYFFIQILDFFEEFHANS